MKQRLLLKFRKPSQAEALLWVILILPFLFGTLIELLRLPSAIKYICDVAWLWLLLLMAIQHSRPTKEWKIFCGVIVGFLLYTLLGYIFNFQSPLYYLWGVRNNFRTYVVFLAVIFFVKQKNRDDFLKAFDTVFWINAVVCLFQYYVLGQDQDNLGGIFGTSIGCNAYLNNYFVVVATKDLLEYLHGKKTLSECILKCGTILVISALAELKFFYVEFVVIVIMAVLLTDFSWKKVLIIIGGFAGVILAVQMLIRLFPEFDGIFSLEAMLETATSTSGYTGQGDLNRLNSISVISKRFLKTFPEQMTGMGLGNCDVATFEVLTTPFYEKYSSLNYSWFSISFSFLETGFIGLGFFFGFFVLIFIRSRKLLKQQPWNKLYCQLAMICAVCCIMIGIYNSSLRNESGYMLYFVLAMPFTKCRYPAEIGNDSK